MHVRELARRVEAQHAGGRGGIDTASQLSHVHLLALSLGIPHAGVPSSLLARLRQHEGRDVLLAGTDRGSVALRPIAEGEEIGPVPRTRMRLDETKLDLIFRRCLSLSELSESDAGVTVGPKVAWLAAFARRFGTLVPPGVAVPFAAFYDHV